MRGVIPAAKSARESSIVINIGYETKILEQYDGRNRLSNFWTPTQRAPADLGLPENGHDLLVRAGFLRQAHSGIFHLLPLGLRVQDKIERLIDKHMQRLGASKVSLSSLSSEELWQRSGRLDKGRTSELLRLEDRKGVKYLLSPTHEEEITTIVANAVNSYKELPLRLYQISRKYRDEPRPRQGLLRGREFLMKDLYTFDANEQQARKTYDEVRRAYVAFLEELRLPYLTARADSGSMGGSLSHEYHFASSHGEDTVISCDKCDYSINEELYIGRFDPEQNANVPMLKGATSTLYISKDRKTLCEVHYPPDHGEPNIYAVKAVFPDIDSSLVGDQVHEAARASTLQKGVRIHDPRLATEDVAKARQLNSNKHPWETVEPVVDGEQILLTKAQEGDRCPNCRDGKLKLQQAVEIGHTFHLGTRYSVPLKAHVLDANNRQVPIEMGCHGIGVSRLIGAVASLLADTKGLNWPLAISPFDAMIIPSSNIEPMDVVSVYDKLATIQPGRQPDVTGPRTGIDVAIDDRDRAIGWKLKDADLVGYPFIVVMGKGWRDWQVVELQCRRLGLKFDVSVEDLGNTIRDCSKQL